MGCGDSKEKIEDEMIKLKFQRAQIQMERKKQIQLLEEIEKKKITEPIIPDYISVRAEKPIVKNITQIKERKQANSDKKAKTKKTKKKSPEKKSKNKSSKGKTKHKKTESTKPESKKIQQQN